MRMDPLTVVLVAPPDSFAWGQSSEVIDTTGMQPAQPDIQEIAPNTRAFVYNETNSKALWCSAGAFRGEPGPASSESETENVLAGSAWQYR